MHQLPDWRYEEIDKEVSKILDICGRKNFDAKKFAKRLGINLIPYSAFQDSDLEKVMRFAKDANLHGFYALVEKDGERAMYIAYDDCLSGLLLDILLLHETGHAVFRHTEQSDHAESEANCFAECVLRQTAEAYSEKVPVFRDAIYVLEEAIA